MKNGIFFVFFIFVFLVVARAQELSEWHGYETDDEQMGSRLGIFDEPGVPVNTPYPADRITNLNAIIPDFQVNENAGPVGADQGHPAIATDDSGNYVIVLDDNRNGDSDIYAQRYNSDGTALGSNFIVNDDLGNANQSEPAISSDGNGDFVIAWLDYRNGYSDYDIYAQRYAGDGTALGSNFRVNDEPGIVYSHPSPAISSDDSGNFVIAWQDRRSGDFYNPDIYAQRYGSDGTAIGDNFRVNDDQENARQYEPAISSDASANFVITWVDYRNSVWDIYAQRYLSDGTAMGSNFRVNDDMGTVSWQSGPDISVNGSGNCVITWEDHRDGDDDIYAQHYASDGTAWGSNFRVNDNQGSSNQGNSAIATDGSGNFVITWQDRRNGFFYENDIYVQRYDSDGTALGSNFRVNDDQGSTEQSDPDISTDVSGNFVITWQDERNNGDYDILAQQYSGDGSAIRVNFKVNDDQGSSYQCNSALATDGSGNFVITWRDSRNGNNDHDIYAQRYAVGGTAIGGNFRVNDDQEGSNQWISAVATASSGNFIITWDSSHPQAAGDPGIYAQRYDGNGTAFGSNFKVSDDFDFANQINPNISADGSGNFVITWEDERNDDGDIYAQRYASDGTALGSNFKVNDDQGNSYEFDPAIATDDGGDFVITWEDNRNGDKDIYARRYTSDGTALGSNFKVNDDQGTASQYGPAISSDVNGNFVITWYDKRFGNHDIYAQHYSVDGTALGGNFRVNNYQRNARHGSPAISMNGQGDFVIVWYVSRYGDFDIYAQHYASDGTAVGHNFKVTTVQGSFYHYEPDVKFWNNRIYTTWTKHRTAGTGWDVWANVLELDNPVGVDARESSQLPSAFALHQNYPNPFNPSTTISYSLPEAGFVVLKIYDIGGREIETLVHEYQMANVYTVYFDANDLASGIFFYKLLVEGNFVETKKMALMR